MFKFPKMDQIIIFFFSEICYDLLLNIQNKLKISYDSFIVMKVKCIVEFIIMILETLVMRLANKGVIDL